MPGNLTRRYYGVLPEPSGIRPSLTHDGMARSSNEYEYLMVKALATDKFKEFLRRSQSRNSLTSSRSCWWSGVCAACPITRSRICFAFSQSCCDCKSKSPDSTGSRFFSFPYSLVIAYFDNLIHKSVGIHSSNHSRTQCGSRPLKLRPPMHVVPFLAVLRNCWWIESPSADWFQQLKYFVLLLGICLFIDPVPGQRKIIIWRVARSGSLGLVHQGGVARGFLIIYASFVGGVDISLINARGCCDRHICFERIEICSIKNFCLALCPYACVLVVAVENKN